jgi:hypothetical protein
MRRTEPGLTERDYLLTLVDLNGDGTPEALIVHRNLTHCGAAACSAAVLELSGPAVREILIEVGGETFTALASRSEGWRDLGVDGALVQYRGGRYVLARPARR